MHPTAPRYPKAPSRCWGGQAQPRPWCRGRGEPTSELLPAARRQDRDKGKIETTGRGKGVTAGHNRIKLGKGNEGLMIDFSTAKIYSFWETLLKEIKDSPGHQSAPREKGHMGSS